MLFPGWNNINLVLPTEQKGIRSYLLFQGLFLDGELWVSTSLRGALFDYSYYLLWLINYVQLSTRGTENKFSVLHMSVQPVFKRFLCLEKEYLSFSLIYNIGERSLDLFSQTSNIFCTYYILSWFDIVHGNLLLTTCIFLTL